MKTNAIFAAAAFLAIAPVHARLLETEGQSQLRYGQPREDLTGPNDKPLITGAIEKAYEYQGWRIRAAFVNGVCHRIEYAHIPVDGVPKQITEPELQKILEAEKGKYSWKEEKSKTPLELKALEKGIKSAFKLNKWERSDKAKAEIALGLVIKIESRDADDLEKKLAKMPKLPGAPGAPGAKPALPAF
jgi:hypothetical protein